MGYNIFRVSAVRMALLMLMTVHLPISLSLVLRAKDKTCFLGGYALGDLQAFSA